MKRATLCLLVALACGCDREPTAVSARGRPPGGTPRSLGAEGADALADRTRSALAAGRIYAPRGDNATELLLERIDRGVATTADRETLAELEPLLVIGVEQSVDRREQAQALRILQLLRRADANAPSLARLTPLVDRMGTGDALIPASVTAQLPPQLETPAKTATVPAQAEGNPGSALATTARTPQAASAASSGAATPSPALSIAAAIPRGEERSAASPPVPPALNPATTSTPPEAATPVSAAARRLVRDAEPEYPPVAMSRGVSGVVSVRVRIAPDGHVLDARAVDARPAGLFNRAAERAALRWQFEPGTAETTATRRLVFDLPQS